MIVVLTFSPLMLVIFLICVFLGDFNINFEASFCILICANYLIVHFTQGILGPKHVHHDSSTSTIDLVFVPDPSL